MKRGSVDVIWDKIGTVADRMDSMDYSADISREERIRQFQTDAQVLVGIVRPVEEARARLSEIQWLETARNYAGEADQNEQSQVRSDMLHWIITWVEELRATLGVTDD
jgi:hypothetical protein